VPTEPVGSPVQVKPHEDGEMWYLPDWGETMRLFGWRWICFVPAIGVLALFIMAPFGMATVQFLIPWFKPILIVVALPIVMLIKSSKTIIRARKEPFCIHCGYGLTGLPDDHNCPECGRNFRFAVIEEYRRDPHWFIDRYRKQKMMPVKDVPFEAGPVRRKRSRDGT